MVEGSMIYFITSCPKHLQYYRTKLYDGIEVLEDNDETFKMFKDWCETQANANLFTQGYDVESTGLDAWVNKTVLRIFGNEETQFIFHTPYCEFKKYLDVIVYNNFELLGHNIKFDLKFLLTEDGILYTKVYDTMIAEQRIYMKSGLRFGLDSLAQRYLDVYPDAMDKSIRMEFVNCNPLTFKIELRHLLYGANDIIHLFPIQIKQLERLAKYKNHNLVHKIEFPMIPIIAKAEVRGFEFNTKQWLEIYEENKKDQFEVECDLDVEIRSTRDSLYGNPKGGLAYIPEQRMYIAGGKWDNPRKHNPAYDVFNEDGSTNALDLFGGTMPTYLITKNKKKIQKAPNNINYGSDTVIIEIFGRLEQPLLTKDNLLAIPQFTKTQKVDKTRHSYQTNEKALNTYLKELPNTIMKGFITMLLKHRTLSKATSTYGANFINHLNSITGNLHTSFRQCATDTGRMSSGGGRLEKDKPNFQNIPSRAKYAIRMRNCFLSKKYYSIDTHDLSGAELIIMCSLSQDMKLLEAAKGDMHSHVAQNCWRRIYAHRARKLIKEHDGIREIEGKDYTDVGMVRQINEYIRLSKSYIVDKTCKQVRTSFKPMTFGVIYGMYAGKAGKTLNIEKEEGQIVIDFIKSEYPDVIAMVEASSAFALANGYIVLNTRTYSRAWFPAIIEAKKMNLDFSDFKTRQAYPRLSMQVNGETSEARNIRIQGTQADMIKECTVELQKWIDDNGYTDEITILSWVHDEIVGEHPDYLNGKCYDWHDWAIVNNNLLSFLNDKGETIFVDNYPELKRLLMIEVCNRYLSNVTMDVDYDTCKFWTK